MPDRAQEPGQSAEAGCPFFLSQRQRVVLSLAAEGLTDVAIGQRLRRSPRTVRAHLQAARLALGASNTTNAVAIALVSGLIRLDAFTAG